MKVLYCAQFDPCGVGIRQRKYLRQLGIDFRVAVERIYWESGLEAEWWLHHPVGCDEQGLRDFAAECDVIIECPAIDQDWSSDVGDRPRGPEEDHFPVVLESKAKRVVLFHGSVNLKENIQAYRKIYEGYRRCATTLDYVEDLDAHYTPSIVEVLDLEPAPLRENGMRIVHAPSDPRVCQSQEFLDYCRAEKLSCTIVRHATHDECLKVKAAHHVGFDHVRGAFSINSLENAGLGLVNLVGVRSSCRDWLRANWGMTLPWPEIETMQDAQREMSSLRNDLPRTRDLQQKARAWSLECWSPAKVAERVLEGYGLA